MLDPDVVSCYDQCKREDTPEDEAKSKAKPDIPVALAIPAHEVSFVRHRSLACRHQGKHHLGSLQKKLNYGDLQVPRLFLAGLLSVSFENCPGEERRTFCSCTECSSKRT